MQYTCAPQGRAATRVNDMKIAVKLANEVVLTKDRFDMTMVKTPTGTMGLTMLEGHWCGVWDPELASDVPLPLHYVVKMEYLYDYLQGTAKLPSDDYIFDVTSVQFY